MDKPTRNAETATPNIQEILRQRRETLNRVRADLDRIGKLQEDFAKEQKSGGSESGQANPRTSA